MTVYRYDLAELERVSADLAALAVDYAAASQLRDDASGALGYPGLRDAVDAFTDGWQKHRERQLEAVRGAGEMLTTICRNYRDFDRGACDDLLAGS